MVSSIGQAAPPAPTSEILDAARAMQPRIRDLAPAIERDRRLPADLAGEFHKAGFFALSVARDLGGREVDPVTALRVVEELALADGSAGWCVMLATQSGAFSGMLPREYALKVHGDGAAVAGVARPIGRAEVRGDVVTVTGRWPFASGSSHAAWFGGECLVYDGDSTKPRAMPNGDPETRMMLLPRDQVVLHDTWNTLGLRGTASNDFSAEGVVVPWGQGVQLTAATPMHEWAGYRSPVLWFVNHGAHALGIARAALESAKTIAGTRVGYGSDRPVREGPRMQQVIGEATASIESARAWFYACAADLWEAQQVGEATPLQRSRARLAASHAAKASLQAVEQLYASLGTSAVFATCPLDRQFRDIRTASAHIMIGYATFEAAGRVEMGLEPAFPFF